jgi:hypothetical protein
VTGRHEGENTGRPDYLYIGRHEALPGDTCRASAPVADPNGEAGGVLLCNLDPHDDPGHFDEADGIWWSLTPAPVPAVAEPAGAVA